MSAGLVAFLNARLDDDERIARAAGDQRRWPVMVTSQRIVHGDIENHVTHIVRWDPARVLAEVAAKRQVIARHTEVLERDRWDDDCNEIDPLRLCSTCARGESCTCCFDADFTEAEMPCVELRLLATVYAGHADYLDEWKP